MVNAVRLARPGGVFVFPSSGPSPTDIGLGGCAASVEKRMVGTVKWFNGAKGYGFILQDNGEDVFVHYSAIQSDGFRTLQAGERVEFELRQGAKGVNAASVVRI